ncbi:tetratricopeptide repeat protein, partial [Bathymodiolus thermophilus thioautotrophic gill symbiont]|uniref:tetratricopeptide repeat protein n=1 Tax=Bathymodiolus thermophilus thioautotrophic gill symbiont TaxID=2360 RepID=UPI0011177DD9
MSDKDVKEMTLDELWQESDDIVDSLDYDRQIEVYTQIIELDPENANVFNNRGNAYSKLKNYEKAIENYNQAIKLKPDHANSFYNRGNVYSDLKRHKKAIEDYDQAIKLKPEYAN